MRIFAGTVAVLLCLPVWAQTSRAGDAPSPTVEAVAQPTSKPTGDAAALEAYVDGIVDAHRREHHAPGISLSVVQNGRILFAKGYGQADVEKGIPLSGPQTLLGIGSTSKTFVWTLVMILHERGLIDLDADVNKYLKNVKIPEAFDKPITMNDLMAHRSGFEDSLAGFNREKYDHSTTQPQPQAGMSEFLAKTMPTRVYPPGTRTSYSNYGATLAAQIVEDVSGVPYETLLDNEILKPLSMNHTTLLGPDFMPPEFRQHLAIGYSTKSGTEKVVAYMQVGRTSPAGGMASTASDMARWMLFHLGKGTLDGVSLMKPQTHDLMWKRAFSDRVSGADVTHGFFNKSIDGVEIFGHGGATSTFFTEMMMAPALDGLGIYISQNSADDHQLLADLAPLVIARLHGNVETPGQYKSTVSAAQFAGTYLNNRRVFTKFEKLLYSLAPATVTAAQGDKGGGGLTVSAVGAPTNYYAPVPGASDTFENRDGERLVFGRDKNGAITHFSDGGGFHSYERVGFANNGTWLFLAMGLAMLFATTTLLGAWRRQGRGQRDQGVRRVLGYGALIAAALVFVFNLSFIWTTLQGLSGVFDFFATYPPTSVKVLRFVAPVLCVVAVAALAGMWPAWRKSSWGVFRKLNYSVFALSLAFLAITLIEWNVVFVPYG